MVYFYWQHTIAIKASLTVQHSGERKLFMYNKFPPSTTTMKMGGLKYTTLHSIAYVTICKNMLCHIWYANTILYELWYNVILYEGQSISFRTDDVKHRKLTLDIRGRHHLQSSPLLRLDNNPSGAATFWSIPGSNFLAACSGRPAILLEFPPASEIFTP